MAVCRALSELSSLTPPPHALLCLGLLVSNHARPGTLAGCRATLVILTIVSQLGTYSASLNQGTARLGGTASKATGW